MAGTYADNLEFNSEALQAQIKLLEQVRDMMVSTKEKYLDYTNSTLRPNWTTENGVKSVDTLCRFAETDIQSFIEYLNGRINDLQIAQQRTVAIDNA